MKVLIVEDDEIKRFQLKSFFEDKYELLEILIAKSFQSGLRSIVKENNSLNLIILDMTMPTFDIGGEEDGGRPQAYAGREILSQMDRRKIFIPVIVVTQFEMFGEGSNILTRSQLDEQLKSAYPKNYMGTVYYNPALEGWKEALNNIIQKIHN